MIKIALVNSLSSGSAFIASSLSSLVIRYYFVSILGVKILGLDTLFASVFLFLSFAELGIGSAITFALYKPIESKDYSTAKSIISLLSKFYRWIVFSIIMLGFVSLFFIENVSGVEFNKEYYFYFVLYVFAAASTFLFAEYKSLALALQLNYIESTLRTGIIILKAIVQVVVLISLESYYYFLVIALCSNILLSLLIRYFVHHRAKLIFESQESEIPTSLLIHVKNNIKGGVYHRLGSVFVTGTDNLLISNFVGVASLGVYSSYGLIITQLTGFLSQLIYPLSGIIGKKNASQGVKATYEFFLKVFGVYSLVTSIVVVGVYFCIDDLIYLWIGKEYLLDPNISMFLALSLYLILSRKPVIICIDALGLNWDIRFKSIFEALVNIIFSLFLLYTYGPFIESILIGTILSNLLVNIWWEPWVVYHKFFNRKLSSYFILYLYQSIMVFVLIYLGRHIEFINSPTLTWLEFIGKSTFVVVYTVVLFFVMILCSPLKSSIYDICCDFLRNTKFEK
ncbi:lipopolysaccharide biosynthesis protein [Vibrio sinaloensis]|uniref:lipopolysaccharide biosynthesis protein n=1 Tax=Photobacterium sp. (strain ATCC 43367) TaxID=379097 RepID=UPI00057E1E2E|nr:hypothetical protein [Vibrio sinaloensis]KHT52225.1 hypothetical protein RJ46_01215 [Vibrio sinaloensis]